MNNNNDECSTERRYGSTITNPIKTRSTSITATNTTNQTGSIETDANPSSKGNLSEREKELLRKCLNTKINI